MCVRGTVVFKNVRLSFKTLLGVKEHLVISFTRYYIETPNVVCIIFFYKLERFVRPRFFVFTEFLVQVKQLKYQQKLRTMDGLKVRHQPRLPVRVFVL